MREFKIIKFIDGSLLKQFIAGNWKYIIFLHVLSVFYIHNRYSAEKIYMDTAKINKEIRELRTESILIATELMNISKEHDLALLTKQNGLDLYLPDSPPKEIVINTEE